LVQPERSPIDRREQPNPLLPTETNDVLIPIRAVLFRSFIFFAVKILFTYFEKSQLHSPNCSLKKIETLSILHGVSIHSIVGSWLWVFRLLFGASRFLGMAPFFRYSP
jgi:hypothetical protein